jgi:hypothetical protein
MINVFISSLHCIRLRGFPVLVVPSPWCSEWLHVLSVFVAFVVEYAIRMRRVVICGLSGSTIFFFYFVLCLIPHDIRKKNVIAHKNMFWFSLQIERDMMKNVFRAPCKVPLLLLSDFNKTWIFSTDFIFLNTQASNIMQIRPAEAELFHAVGQTDMTKLILLLTLRLLMSYIYGAPIFDLSRSHTTTQHSR